MPEVSMHKSEQDRRLVILAILSSIFLLNDYLFLMAGSLAAWLMIDYGSRLLAIGIVLWLIRRKLSAPAEFGLRGLPLRSGLPWMLLLTGAGVLIDQVGWRVLEQVLPNTQLATMPKIQNPFMNYIDLTFGVALVAVSEEIVFRGYCFSALQGRWPSWVVVAISAVLFGMIHWSQGLHAIVSTALWGILPMVAMARTGSIFPSLIAHYITDLISLGGFVPETWFSFIK
jgi:membrane protease YdiL (CAAX protease family)